MLTSRSLFLTRPTQLLVAALAAVCLMFTSFAATAGAVPGPNQTQLTLDPVLVAGLKTAKIGLSPKGSATIGSAGLYFPVTNAVGVTDAFVGTTKHQGGFELKIAKTISFGLRNIVVKTRGTSPVTGIVTAEPVLFGVPIGIPLTISKITVNSVQVRPPGVIAKYKLVLDPAIIKLANSTLGIKILSKGQPWATVETRIARTPAVAPTTPAATTPPAAQ